MQSRVMDADSLKGKQVAFTGRLASLSRKEAAELVSRGGGRFVAGVGEHTAWLVVGQEGWPLAKDGRLTNKLRKARRLQRQGKSIAILSEEEFLARAGLGCRSEEIRRLHNTSDLTRLLNVSRRRVRAWINAGLVRPVETRQGVAYFDFRQVSGARTLCDLIKAGVTVERIRRSLKHLQAWAGSVKQPLEQLAILEKDGSIVVRLEEGLAETSGQLLFDFGEATEEPCLSSDPAFTRDEWFDIGCEHEDAGRFLEAEAAYRQALLVGGPDAGCCFNLANVLHLQGRSAEAAERFHQTLELDGNDAAAWNNLGMVLCSLKRFDEARNAFQKAVELGHADAHYNLADLLDELGEDATTHWKTYLRHDSHSPWARHARARIAR